MQYTIRAVLRATVGFSVVIGLLAGCSTLVLNQGRVSNQEKALRDYVDRAHGPETAQRVRNWLALRKRLLFQSSLTELRKVQLANDFFNALPYQPDDDLWQQEDYWATPLETLLNNGGDCEDLAIAKYFTLLAGGIDPDRLRLTYAWQLSPRQAHVVLSYFPADGREALVLDNLKQETLSFSERRDLEAVYSFDMDKLWLADDEVQALRVPSQERIAQWRKVNQRMELEAEKQNWLL